jgi:uncharacterized membrane protein HdeD (DUF308 family)
MSLSPEPAATKRAVSIGAIVIGYATFAGLVVLLNVLSFVAPRKNFSLAAAVIAAVVAGYVAGVSARRDEGRHGVILGVVLAVAAAAPVSVGPRTKDWLIWIGLAIIPLGAAAGGFIRARQQSMRRARAAGASASRSL